MNRLLKQAQDNVYTEWSRPVFEKLGARFQRALLMEAILAIAALQDEEVPDAKVRALVEEGYLWAAGVEA